MKRWLLAAGLVAVLSGRVSAQTSLDVIEQDLAEAKRAHDAAVAQSMQNFLTSLDAASQSGAQALDLYNRAGGKLPDLTPVRHYYDYETPSERERREAQDAQNYAQAAIVIQVHCGLMKYAALLGMKSPPPDAQDQFVAWLKSIGPVYPQLGGERALKTVAMRDSVISSYLQYHGWGNAPQGSWTVRDIPRLYREQVLEPLRHPPGAGTLDAWDTYSNMVQADCSHDEWTAQEPAIDFDRAADDFAIEPTMDKLTTLDALIKANQADDHLNDWITRMNAMINTYRSAALNHSSLPGPTAGSPTSEVGGVTTAATPGTPSAGGLAPTPAATPGSPTSGTYAPTPMATPGVATSGGTAPTPTATPGTPSSGTYAPTPAATPGIANSGATAPAPTATPGTPASGTYAPTPAATPGTPSSGNVAPAPTATPGTPSSGGTAPAPTGI